MKKNTLNENIKKCKAYAKHMPKSIFESMQFENDDVEDDDFDVDEEVPEEPEVKSGDAKETAAQLIDSIRKQALRAMADLADTPEDENYIMLKKVWQMTDRKPEDGQKKVSGQNF